jgi:hypothetical protein
MTTDTDIAAVLRLERELQSAECRRDRARVSALLAEDFSEVGASGRIWDRPATGPAHLFAAARRDRLAAGASPGHAAHLKPCSPEHVPAVSHSPGRLLR